MTSSLYFIGHLERGLLKCNRRGIASLLTFVFAGVKSLEDSRGQISAGGHANRLPCQSHPVDIGLYYKQTAADDERRHIPLSGKVFA